MGKTIGRIAQTILVILVLAAVAAPAFAAYEHYAIRINCGGGAYDASFADHYIADQGYTPANGAGAIGGVSASTTIPIDGTTDDPLYQTARQGVDFQYKFDVPNGWYKVKLQFAEIVHGNTRSFEVLINGSVVKSFAGSSVSAAAGGMYKAYDLEFFTNVTNGQIIVDFRMAPGAPGWDVSGIINAISVTKVKPQSTSPVQISGRQILVNGQPFQIKGVGYQPVPVGEDLMEARFEIFADPNIYIRDLDVLQAMNCNTIRTWGKVIEGEEYIGGPFTPATDFLDACAARGIYVAMGFHPWNQANIDPDNPNNVRQDIINEFKAYVAAYKDHPAVLMWSIGNENNYWQSSSSWDPTMTHEELMRHWYSLVNEMAWAAYEVEGADYHPVTHPNGGVTIIQGEWGAPGPIGDPLYNTDDASMTYLDVWGANIYTAWNFDGSLPEYGDLSRKPFWISEYGFPGDNERFQAAGADIMWDEILTFSSICSGSAIMAYSDEWWKYCDSSWDEAARIAHLSKHDFWLGTYNEEYWGVVSIEDTGPATPDKVHPKLVYYTLQEKWAPANEKRNLALDKPVYASSVEGGRADLVAANAVDGNHLTRWSSAASDPQWIYVDLGAVYNIGQVVLRWEDAYAAAYEVQVSYDANTWTTVYSTTDGQPYTNFIYLDDNRARARYVRMHGTARATPYGYSLWEFKVFEPLTDNVAVGKTAYASAVEDNIPQLGAASAIDGNFASRWSSDIPVPSPPIEDDYIQWIYIDLGAYYDISQVVLRWEPAYAKEYKIQTSSNGADWTDVYVEMNGNGMDDYIDFAPAITTRYLRLYCIKRGTPYGYSLWELQVKGIIHFPSDEGGCQIGAFIADWAKSATFPWGGEQGIQNYEAVIQREVAVVKLYAKIVDEFPMADCLTISNHGTSATVPLIDINPKISDTGSPPILGNIINGDFDIYINNWAQQAKAYGKPLYISFDGEMNGAWGEPMGSEHVGSGYANGGGTLNGYGDPAKPDGPERYVDAWRHIHGIFKAVGADNVAWVWAVNNTDWPADSWNEFENYYPGDAYVDWLGVDGYNWNFDDIGWLTFEDVFETALYRLRAINADKPIMLAEFGCAQQKPDDPPSHDKSVWITDCFNLLKTTYPYTAVECFIWFDMDKERNWLIDSDGNTAPRTALSDPYFKSKGDPGTPTINPALNKAAVASSVEGPAYAAAKAVDGNLTTRWSSTGQNPGNPAPWIQWVYVDLGTTHYINQVVVRWEAAYASSYEIQVSDDAVNWTPAYSTSTGDGNNDYIAFSPLAHGRYVRLYCLERGPAWAWGYSLWELEIYGTTNPPPAANFVADATSGSAPFVVNFTDTSIGNITAWSWDFGDQRTSTEKNPSHKYPTPGVYTVSLTAMGGGYDTETKEAYITVNGTSPGNAAFGKPALSSSVEGNPDTPTLVASGAFDHDMNTRWSSEAADPQWIYVDLGAAYDIYQVVLRWEYAYGKSYKVQKSVDGSAWIDVYTMTTGDGQDDYIDFDPSFVARYVRLYCTERGTPFGYSLWEFHVMGAPTDLEGSILVPDEYPTIQQAVNAAGTNYRVDILNGTYTGDITIPDNKAGVVIGGAGNTPLLNIIEGNITLMETEATIRNLKIIYDEGDSISFNNDHYTDFNILSNAGITALDSDLTVQNCVISPSAAQIGNGIQIWNLYGSEDIEPIIENNSISNTETAIYYYSQAFGGGINGVIRGNIIDSNVYGITLRMHKECPTIDDNTISNSSKDGIHLTYEDGDLLTQRISHITPSNIFTDNNRDIYCDETGAEPRIP